MPVELMYGTFVKSSTTELAPSTCEYAASSGASASRSMSPVSSITALSPSSRTRASSSAVAIAATSFQLQDELDHVPALGVRDAQLVDHVLDQEETPAARLLEARELRFEVGRLGVAGRPADALVRDPDDERAVSNLDVDLDRQVLARLVAVLDGVHRRLGDRRLELLEAPRLDP